MKKEKNIIDKLFSLGPPQSWGRSNKGWINYLEMGYGQVHIPDLIKISTDAYLLEEEDDPIINSAPIHAWRALAQLEAHSAIQPMLGCFDIYARFGDIGLEEIPVVMGMIGEKVIEPMYNYLIDSNREVYSRVMAQSGLVELAKYNNNNKEICNTVIDKLTLCLKNHSDDSNELNTLIICSLLELHRIEPLPNNTIKEIANIYGKGVVEEFGAGDLEDVEIELGVRKERTTPKRQSHLQEMFLGNNPEIGTPIKPIASTKIGRNEPCPCGSGKKYKKCCHQNKTVH